MRSRWSLLVLSLGICFSMNSAPVLAEECFGPSSELWKASQDAATRIIETYSEGRDFSPRDQRLVKAARVACSVGNVKAVTDSIEYTKLARRDLVGQARSAAERLLAIYNASDGDVRFDGEDLRIVEVFQHVAVALVALRRMSAPTGDKPPKVGSEVAKAAAGRVVEAFNSAGWTASFDDVDLEVLGKFAKEVGSQ